MLYCSGEVWVRWSTLLLKIHKYAYSLINTIEKTYYRTLCFISFKITSCVKLCLTPPIFNFKVAISVFKFNKAKTFPTELHRHLALHHFFPTMDHLQWMGAVRMRVQTAGLLWCFYQLFGLSFWRHPFTAEHPLLRQWCNDTFLQICWRNKLIYILDDLRVSTFSECFHSVPLNLLHDFSL